MSFPPPSGTKKSKHTEVNERINPSQTSSTLTWHPPEGLGTASEEDDRQGRDGGGEAHCGGWFDVCREEKMSLRRDE